jgi:hypothetical protein
MGGSNWDFWTAVCRDVWGWILGLTFARTLGAYVSKILGAYFDP